MHLLNNNESIRIIRYILLLIRYTENTLILCYIKMERRIILLKVIDDFMIIERMVMI